MEENKEFDIGQSDNKSGKGMGWYVVHTYSGYENKVKANIEKAIENRHLENEILEVRVPMQDVVEVKNGYGRNYLIPQGKAVIATPSALKVLAENQRQRAHKLAKIKADAEALAASLEGVTFTIATKVSATGTIFGAVNAIQVSEALEKLGHNIDRKLIVIKDTIKEVGNYTATINLHKEVSVEIPFEVVAE